jgi:hypothetical protein
VCTKLPVPARANGLPASCQENEKATNADTGEKGLPAASLAFIICAEPPLSAGPRGAPLDGLPLGHDLASRLAARTDRERARYCRNGHAFRPPT